MSRLEQGSELDGFRVGPLLHAGAMARIYQITYADPDIAGSARTTLRCSW